MNGEVRLIAFGLCVAVVCWSVSAALGRYQATPSAGEAKAAADHLVVSQTRRSVARTADGPESGASPELLFAMRRRLGLDWALDHSGGMDDAPDGTLYVVDPEEHRVMRFSPDGNVLAAWGTYGSEDGRLFEPGDVAVGPDGSVYVSDSRNFRIQHFTGDGRLLGGWGGSGTVGGLFGREYCWGCGPGSITVDAEGRVFVDDPGSQRVQVFSAVGTFLWDWYYPVPGASLGTTRIVAMRADPAGTVLMVLTARSDPAGTQFTLARRYDRAGTLVAEWELHTRYTPRPAGMAVADDGTIYITFEGHPAEVQVFAPDGTLIRSLRSDMLPEGQRFGPVEGIAVTGDGSVFIGGVSPPWIKRYDDALRFETAWGDDPAPALREWSWPSAIAAAANGEFFVAYESEWKIERFDVRGTVVATWRSEDYEGVDMSSIVDLTVGPTGLVYVLQQEAPRVLVLQPDGVLVRAWGETGTAPGLIARASDIVVTPDEFVLISDGQGRIQRFTLTGLALGLWKSIEPLGMAIKRTGDGRSDYEVVALGLCIIRYAPDGRELGRLDAFPDDPWLSCYGDLDDAKNFGMNSLPYIPRAVAPANDGSYFVSTTFDVRHLSASGVLLSLQSRASRDSWPEGFYDSRDLVVMPDDIDPDGPIPPSAVIVTDTEMYRLAVFGQRRPLWRVDLFDNPWLMGVPALMTTTKEVDLDWSGIVPAPSAPAERFSARLDRRIYLSDTVRVSLMSRGGARLWVGDELLVDDWYADEISFDRSFTVSYGEYPVRLEVNATDGESAIRFDLAVGDVPTPTPTSTSTPRPTPLPSVHLPWSRR